MIHYGYRTAMIFLFVEMIFVIVFYDKPQFSVFIIAFLLVDLIFFGLISVSADHISVYTMSAIFDGVYRIPFNRIAEIQLRGAQGMTRGRMDARIITRDGKKYTFFMLLYPFERKKLEKRLSDFDVVIKGV